MPVRDSTSSTRPHSVAWPLDASGLYWQSLPLTTTGALFVASARPGLAAFAMSWNSGKMRIRSEEHTSELQSLMRISYAVFCLKKKKLQYKLTKSDISTDNVIIQ